MGTKAARGADRIRAAKERDTSLYIEGSANLSLIGELRRMDGLQLGKLLQSSKMDARAMAPNREKALQVLGAAQTLVNERIAQRARQEMATTQESPPG